MAQKYRLKGNFEMRNWVNRTNRKVKMEFWELKRLEAG